MGKNKARIIAIHLPQFHPIPENDRWWGKGFTEWTNVVSAKPLFPGHYQPQLPADLGFYDLRLHESRVEQAKLASEYGIHGFCYYHYWFNGKTLLEKPLEALLKRSEPNFPFCLCWANENWTRIWDGQDNQILIKQNHNLKDDLAHIQYLIQFFKDERYIKIDDKPVFLVYRSELIPEMTKTINLWRKTVKRAGFIDLYIIRVESMVKNVVPIEIGFDASMDFQPNWSMYGNKLKESKREKFFRWLRYLLFRKNKVNHYANNNIYSYREYVTRFINFKEKPEYKKYPGVFPGWDNSPRKSKGATIFTDSEPEIFKDWFLHILRTFEPYSTDENLIFINAWNEWAEGNHLEPCQKWGRSYLESVRKAIDES